MNRATDGRDSLDREVRIGLITTRQIGGWHGYHPCDTRALCTADASGKAILDPCRVAGVAAQLALAQARLRELQSLVQIYRSLGGAGSSKYGSA